MYDEKFSKIYEEIKANETIDWEKSPADAKKMKKGVKVVVIVGPHKGQMGKVLDFHDYDKENDEEAQIDIKLSSGKTIYLGKKDVRFA
jgi:hypothetical protein